jgi:uncharacterized heparinase superfamily protein
MMTDLSQRDRAILAARRARAELIESIDEMVPEDWRREVLRLRVEALYNACSLVVTQGEEPVYRDAVSKLRREEP